MNTMTQTQAEAVELPQTAVRDRLADVLREWLGVDTVSATTTVEHLIRTEQAGKDCHGLIRVHYLTQSGKFGPYAGRCPPAPHTPRPGCLHVNGRGHLGYAVMHELVTAGCEAATRFGHCVVTGAAVYPSGCLGDWARCAAGEGVASVIMAGSPPRVAAPGAGTPVVGTNPLCIGVPTDALPFISDASTSEITHGELLIARERGRPLPRGSAVDAEGGPVTDPQRIDPTKGLGALLPVGGSHKSFAAAMAIELLSSLGGGVPGSPTLSQHGIFMLFLGPELLGDLPQRSGAWLRTLDEEGVRVPGWRSGRRLAEQQARGVVRVSTETRRILQPWLES